MAVLAGVLRPYDPVVWSSIDLTVRASTQVVDASRSPSALPFWLKFALGLAPAHPPPRGRASLSYFEAERSKIDENWFDNGFSVGSGHRNRKGAKPTGPWRCAGVTLPTDLVRGRDVRGAEVLFRGVLYEMRWSENGVLGCRFLCDSYGPSLFLRTTFATLKGSRLACFSF